MRANLEGIADPPFSEAGARQTAFSGGAGRGSRSAARWTAPAADARTEAERRVALAVATVSCGAGR